MLAFWSLHVRAHALKDMRMVALLVATLGLGGRNCITFEPDAFGGYTVFTGTR